MNESLQGLVSSIYAMLHIQFTKISKENHYYIGTNLEEIKKSTKRSTKGVAKFAGCENLQPYEISQDFCSPAKLLGLLAYSLHCFSSFNFLSTALIST